MTVLFALFGAAVVLSEALRLDLSTRPLPIQVLANCGCLIGAWAHELSLDPRGGLAPGLLAVSQPREQPTYLHSTR